MNTNFINKAFKASASLGHLRGYMVGEILYNNNITPSHFKSIYEALQRSYELAGDGMDEFDTSRIEKRAEELGVTI